MATIEPTNRSLSVVVLGDFLPKLYHPLWFATNGLIPEEEVKTAEVHEISKELAHFTMGSFIVDVQEDGLSLTVNDTSKWIYLRDLACGTTSLHEQTPLEGVLFIQITTYPLGTESTVRQFGNWLLPQGNLKNWVGEPTATKTILNGTRPTSKTAPVLIQLELKEGNQFEITVTQQYLLEHDKFRTTFEHNNEARRIIGDDLKLFWEYASDFSDQLVHSIIATPLTQQAS